VPPAGAILLGRVVSVRPFGAFIALNGYQKHGLVHISQLAKQRVERVEDVVADGDAVKVKVLQSDDPLKISLSLRQVDQLTGEDLGDEAPARRRGGQAADDDIPRNADGSYAWGTLQPLEREEEAQEAPAEPKVRGAPACRALEQHRPPQPRGSIRHLSPGAASLLEPRALSLRPFFMPPASFV
jgi:predicted RNA-binding protein with RPS1 domain